MSRVGIEQAIGANFDQVISASAQLAFASQLKKQAKEQELSLNDYITSLGIPS
jgi:hypothetical protein